MQSRPMENLRSATPDKCPIELKNASTIYCKFKRFTTPFHLLKVQNWSTISTIVPVLLQGWERKHQVELMAIQLASAMATCLMLHCKNSTKVHSKLRLQRTDIQKFLLVLEGAPQTLTWKPSKPSWCRSISRLCNTNLLVSHQTYIWSIVFLVLS